MNFNEFKKEIKDIQYRSEKDWEIFLPFNTKREMVQKIIDICRNHLIVDWHIIYPEPTELVPEPETCIYWDRKNFTPSTECDKVCA